MSRATLKSVVDILLWVAVAPIAFRLRLDRGLWAEHWPDALIWTAATLPLKFWLHKAFNLDRAAWSKFGFPDLLRLGRAVGVLTLLLYAGGYVAQKAGLFFPRSEPLIEGLLALAVLGSARLTVRLLEDRGLRRRLGMDATRVLIVGAGEAGAMMAREMRRHPEAGLVPVGFIDDDPVKHGTRVYDLPVLGPIVTLLEHAAAQSAGEVVIAIPSAPGATVRRIVELARGAGLRHRIVPGLYDLLSGKVSIGTLRNVEVTDLLRRAPVHLDRSGMAAYLRDKVVLITGAGGSIGSELVRQVCAFGPRRLLLLGRGENSLYEIELELRQRWPEVDARVIVGDVRDADKVGHVFRDERPQVVFHAAAHKHVPMMEANPDEAVLNNVGGTRNLVEAALSNDVEAFVNISTDKAVNPTSVMGASKRVAEMIVADAASRAGPLRRFVSVRFGNVLGSRGSVIPVFRRQIAAGGPVTVTHPDMRRYFMTIPEAVRLVLAAGALEGAGAVYILDMGEQVRIVDLAEDLIRLSGLVPGEDIRIEFTGVRPGEKLYEELLTDEEGTDATRVEKLMVARTTVAPSRQQMEAIAALLVVANGRHEAGIRSQLQLIVPTFHNPSETQVRTS